MHTKFWSENLKRRDHLEYPDVYKRTDIREIVWEVLDWTQLAQDTDQWRAVAITVMNLGFLKGQGIF
jgi:hypothetical protein